MTVSLVSYTTPARSLKAFHDDTCVDLQHLIAYVARVSNPANQNYSVSSEKLIQYMIKHNHWSPFEMVSVCLEINTTRDIARQILRHRSFSFQEFSQRYANPTEHLTTSIREARLQDEKNRQASIEVTDSDLMEHWNVVQSDLLDNALEAYHWAISKGIAKEQARAVLPEGLTMSRMYMQGSLRSWIHYISVRTAPETQKEHRQVALACAEAIAEIFPLIKTFISSVE